MGLHLSVEGTVQGVGFRPFVYRMAKKYGLSGYVQNSGNHVDIIIDSNDARSIDIFLKALHDHAPPLARINHVTTTHTDIMESYPDGFTILESKNDSSSGSIIPPDTAICPDCVREMTTPANRRYRYPFTVCNNCGMRYASVDALPYDRPHTTFSDFKLCTHCRDEYGTPENRRYHVQSISCPDCGPTMILCNRQNELSRGYAAIQHTARQIDKGHIVAIKGFCGTHIAVDATNDGAVKRLREKIGRPYQPFALMVKDADTASGFVQVDKTWRTFAEDVTCPIMVSDKKTVFTNSSLKQMVDNAAPKLHNIGVMLAYTGIHHLLLDEVSSDALIMTSANMPGLPMLVDNHTIKRGLGDVCDYFLLHDLTIANRCDDSVIRLMGNNPSTIRRSRGYVPVPIELPFELPPSLGTGAELNATLTLASGNRAYISQHIGNTSKLETLDFYKSTYSHLSTLTGIMPQAVGCDLHPYFNTTRFADGLDGVSDTPLRIQHHHAHLISLMAEHGLYEDTTIIGIAADGVGYGDDATAWGGEVLHAGYTHYERISHLVPQPMPGGDAAAISPSRMVFGMLADVLDESELKKLNLHFKLKNNDMEQDVVLGMLSGERRYNMPHTSAAGRVLDAASALLGICSVRTYEGECAMKLESVARGVGDARGTKATGYPRERIEPDPHFIRSKDGRMMFDTTHLLLSLLDNADKPIAVRAYFIEESMGMALGQMAVRAAKSKGVGTVGFSGGVGYNEHIVSVVKGIVEGEGLRFLTHMNVPCGDGGVSLGQAVCTGLRYAFLKS